MSIRNDGRDDRRRLPADSAADTSACVPCPYCGAEVELILDPDGGATQKYVEDCEVCCRPWQLTVRWDPGGAVLVEALTDDG